MSNVVKQTIEITQIANVSNVLDNINKIKGALKELAVPSDLQEGFDKAFSNAEKQVEKASKAMASGFKTKGSVEAYEQAMTQIVGIFDDLNKRIERLNNQKVVLKTDITPFKQLNEEIDKLNDDIKKAGKSIESLKELKRINNLGSGTGNRVESWEKLVKAYKDGNITAATNALKTLKGMLTKHEGDANYSKGTNWESFDKDYTFAVQKVKELSDAQEEYAKKVELKNKKEAEAAQYTKRAANTYDQVKNATQQSSERIKIYAKDSAEAARSTQQLNSELEHFKSKAAYFFGIANGINLFKRALRSAYNTVKDLDAVMTETAVVTNFDVSDMWSQLPEYTQRANELGVTIHDTYEAATLFYQQGLKTNEVMQISNETLKMARIAGLDAATASDRMTNALRGFNMELDELSAKRVNDVYSKLAAITASNTDEISTAMTKVASLAHNANMEFETTAAFLAQIIESTRESAETAGTALKTVVARFSEVKKLYTKGELTGQDEEGQEIDVNKVSTALRSAGIDLNEYLTGAKGLDDIFIELAEKWDNLDQVQQRYIATMAAGSRQQSRFIALMSNYSRTAELVDAANNANGASQEQYNKTLDSLQTKLARLKNAWNEFILGLSNSDAIKTAVDMLTKLITVINDLIKKISNKNAGVKMITSFFTAFTAFKIGSKLTGSNNPIVQMLSAFVGSGKAQIASTAQSTADLFVGDFKKNILKSAKNKINNNDLFKYFFKNTTTKYSVNDMSALRTGIGQQISAEGVVLDAEGKQAINAAINSGEINKVNDALRQQGVQFQINEKNARQFGVTAETVTAKNINSYKLLGAAVTAVGGIMMVVGDSIAAQGEDYENLGYFIKTLGAAMMVLGTIMSVVLPLKAQIMSTSISAAISSIPIVGWIAAIIAAVAALGVAIYKWNKSQAFEAKMKKANDACKQAADAADEAAKAYEELGKSLESLQGKYDAINEAAVGTQKWRDAIREANDEVLKLVETYTELEVVIGKDGVLEVTEESKNLVEENLRNAKNMTQAASYGAQMYRTQLKKDKTETDWSGTNLTGRGDTWKIDGVDYNEDKVKEKVVEAYKNGQIHSVDQLKTFVDQFLPEEQRNNPNIKSPINKYGFESLKSYVNDSELVKAAESHINGVISSSLTKMGDKESINLGKNLISTDTVKNAFDAQLKEVSANRNLSDKQDEFARNSGYDSYADWKEKANDGKEISEVRLNYQLAMQRTQKNTDKFVEAFEGRISNLTSEQRKLFEEAEGGALTSEEVDRLKNQKDEIYKSLGGDEAFANLKMNQDGFNKYIDSILDTASKNAGIKIAGIGEELVSDLTSGARKSLDENLKSVFIASGKEGRDKITDMINELTKGLDSDSKKGFMRNLSQIDWTSANSVRSLSELVKEYGISEDAVNDLEQQIIELNNAATKIDLKNVTTQLKSLLGLGKKIATGEQGRNFNEEQVKQLTEAGIDPSKFVYNIQTGEYNYTGVLDDILKAINEQTDKMVDTSQLEKDVTSGTAAKEMWDKGTPESNEDKIAFIRDYMLKAGDSSKISKDMLQVASYMAKGGDFSTADKLIKIIENEKEALPERQNELDNVALEKEIMKRQMNTGAQNAFAANQGNEAAKKALEAQVSSSDMSEELKQKLLSGMGNSGYVGQDWTKTAGNLTDTFNQAKSAGFKAEELNAYANSLRQVNDLEHIRIDDLYSLALAEMNYQTGQQSLYDSYDSWSKLIQKNGGIVPDGSIEQGKIFDKLNKDIQQMLNLSEKLPDSFLKSKDNVDLLKKAIKGDKEAVAKLRAEAAKVQVGNLDGTKFEPTVDKTGLENAIDDLAKEMPDLEIGATLDQSKAGMALKNLVDNANMSASQIENLFKSLGWDPKIEWVEASYSDVQKTAQNGYIEQPDGKGGVTKVKLQGEDEYETGHKFYVPKIGNNTKFTAPKPPKKNPTTKKKPKGGGGGKKSKAKKERWENPYDELYNLQEKINEALRKREALERRYQKLLKQHQTSLKDVRAAYSDQIKHMKSEINLQKQLAEGRLNQINKLGKDTYVTSKGKVKTFEQMGVTKYAKYNKETGEIQIDWAGINKLEGTKHVETGKAVEAYISKLEELVKGYEDTRDAIWDIEDKIEDLRQQVIETYLTFEDRVLDALVTKYQRQIDSYQAMSDAIDKVNNEVIKSLREQIDLSRQIRDNTKKEEDISKKENRLAYLRRDTSGANDLEILSLEKELKEAREDYSDNLIDQTIDKLQEDADKASEQRERQIEVMQAQLDIMQKTGGLWDEAYKLLNDAEEKLKDLDSDEEFAKQFKLTDLAKLLAKSEDISSLSEAGFLNWLDKALTDYRQVSIGRDEIEKKWGEDVNKDGKITTEPEEPVDIPSVIVDFASNDERNHGIAIGAKLGGYGWSSNTTQLEKQLKDKGFNENDIREILAIFKAVNKTNWKQMWPNLKLSNYSIDKFARGGLADYTGPAWLDGTKTNPELVLNAQDTRNFIALKDILSSLMGAQGASTKTSGGDNYFDINITADIGSDYDVDKLANRIKKQIFEDSQYRNVNTINYLR